MLLLFIFSYVLGKTLQLDIMDIKDYVEKTLPELESDKLDDAVSFLKELGVIEAADIKLLDQSDLMPYFNLIQCRKLLKFNFAQSKP